MNEHSGSLNVNIGIIVTGAYFLMFNILGVEKIWIVGVLFFLSCALWLLVWDFALGPQSIWKRIVLFGIHVLATTIAPFMTIFGSFGTTSLWLL